MRISGDAKTPSGSEQLHKGSISSLRYLAGYLRPHRLMIACALLALLITSSSVLGLGYALRTLVDEGISKGDATLLNRSYLILLSVVCLLALTTYMRYFLVTWIGEKVVAHIRRDMYHHLIGLDVTFYETNRTGELLSRLTTDTTLIQSVVGSSVSVALRNIILLIGGMTMLAVTSAELTAYVLLIVPLVVIPILLLGKKVRVLSRQTQDKVADINVHAEETIYAIQTIQAFTLEEQQKSQFNAFVDASLKTSRQRIAMRALLTAIVITLVLGAVATVLWFGGQKVIAGTISAGELSSFVYYAVVVAGSTGAISEVIGDLQRAAGAVERLAELKAQQSVLVDIPKDDMDESLPATTVGRISFQDVRFHYPSRPDEPALDGVSFSIEKGQTIAFVGPSGSGKSTIFRLLLRYYDPASGYITLEDKPLDTLPLFALRSRLGIVSQDPVIFSASAFDNIALGKATATLEEVKEAARQAEILDFIESLPEGFNAFLGEKGIRLSGGQKQRIAIARALIRSPDILLLDEATSALDSENERKVQSAFGHVMRGRTTLVIAHRLATVREADAIILLNRGKVEAIGTHDQLLHESDLYRTLATQQFRTQ